MFRKFTRPALVLAVATVATFGAIGCSYADHTSGSSGSDKPMMARVQGQRVTNQFQGVKANKGYATETIENGRIKLAVSDDFVIPDTPAPSWQVVDSQGNVYLLNQMKIKGGTNRSIILPTYIHDVQKVQVWCSYAEVLLGEASFK